MLWLWIALLILSVIFLIAAVATVKSTIEFLHIVFWSFMAGCFVQLIANYFRSGCG